ncbi:MAG: hypothetical protein QOE74_4073 [Mycobacterium sp.]|jgi:hypothetical protein|nr:hypothetical protein [Mycobacterium sp.]
MNTQSGGLRLLCPQGCGATLTVPMPTLAARWCTWPGLPGRT